MSSTREGFKRRLCARYLSGAILLVSACAPLTPHGGLSGETAAAAVRKGGPEELEKGKALVRAGRFAEATLLYRKLARSGDRSIAEGAQFALAHTLADYRNPGKDYSEALNEFQAFSRKYSESPLKEEAANWSSLLALYLAKKNENETLKSNLQKLVDIDIEAEKKQKTGK